MPHRFLLAESMDVAKAWTRWEATLEWRKENKADNILLKPHPRCGVRVLPESMILIVTVTVIFLLYSSSFAIACCT